LKRGKELQEYLLGIDIGTNACKVLISDAKGEVVAKCMHEYSVNYPRPTWAEQDADVWWDAVKITVKDALRKARHANRKIVGIGVASQREAPIPLDRKGRKLDRSLIWLDRRTLSQAKQIKSMLSFAEVIRITGLPIDYFSSAAKMLWMKQERPRIFEKTSCFLFPKDYVIYKLTGAKATDFSMASRTMLLDIQKRQWSERVCDALGISPSVLPVLVESTDIVGEVSDEASKETGLQTSTQVVSGGGDRPVEAIGAGTIEVGQINIGTGTATTVTTPLAKPNVDLSGRVDCCCHVIPDMWEYEVAILTTGASLRWFRDNFGFEETESSLKTGIDSYDYVCDLAAKVHAGSDGLFYYPYPMGAKSPKFNPQARGVFFGQTLVHKKAHFVRSILEGIAFQYAETLELLGKMGVRVKEASIVGGEARSSLWNQIKADVSGIRITRPHVEDAAALGSAVLASVGVGVHPSVKSAARNMVRTQRVYEPRLEQHREYVTLYHSYKTVYECLETAFKFLGH
jgi:xylulokinase